MLFPTPDIWHLTLSIQLFIERPVPRTRGSADDPELAVKPLQILAQRTRELHAEITCADGETRGTCGTETKPPCVCAPDSAVVQ